MADQRKWRDASTLPSGEGVPGDTTWTLGFTGAAAPDTSPDARTPPSAVVPSQIVFIEGSVADYQILADGVRPGVKVVILNPDANGVQQIADYLQHHDIQNLSAISIVADGANGEIQLGNTLLSAANVADYTRQLAAIGTALAPGGDLLLYGCDVAQNGAGDAFLGDLAAATGVGNIAAASHVVGAAADGGSFNLDVDVGNAAATIGPFTAAATAAYPDLLGIASDLVWYSPQYTNATGGGVYGGVYRINVNGGATATNATDVKSTQSTPSYAFGAIEGIAIDPADGHYFVSNITPAGVNQIIEGNTNSIGTPTVIYTSGNSGLDTIIGVTFDPQNGLLYMAVTDAYATNDTGIYTINALGSGTQTAHELVNLNGNGIQSPSDIAIDTTHNLLFYASGYAGFSTVEEIGVATLAGGYIINADLVNYENSNSGNQTPYGIAVNPATDTLYWTTVNDPGHDGDVVYSATYTIGSSVTLSNIQTLATTQQQTPQNIGLDVPAGGYYVGTSDQVDPTANTTISFASRLTQPALLTTVYSVPPVSGSTVDTTAIVVETQPTVTASGTVTYDAGGAAVAIDSGATVSDADGYNLASATVSIASGMGAGDTLNFTTQNGITGSYSSGTLTLTGVQSAANYQTALDSVTFATTSTSATARTIDWTVSDGIVTSPTTTSTVDVHVAPTITAGATATFDGGGSPVVLESGLVVTDASSTMLASATIAIVGSISADRLNFTAQNGISGSFNTSTGTLVLSGVASIGNYQTALASITYSVSPSNSDPTGGGGHTTRTIDWSVNDAVLNSGAVTSTVDTIHVKPTVTAGGTATFDGGGAPVKLDSGVAVSDPDSGGVLSSATVTVANAITGDTLNFSNTNSTTEGNIGVASDSSGALVLTSTGTTATLAQWQTALESVTYSFSPSNGDPTDGGTDNSRTVDWAVMDGAGASALDTSSLTVLCFCAGTRIATPGGEVPVEQLAAGGQVLTQTGAARRIAWIGAGRVQATRGSRNAATPVIIRKGAFADNVPYEDLRVTKGHAFHIDSVLIPIEYLVNHRSILWDDHAQEVRLYHVELETHDVLLANGAPAESYRDDGNRWLFNNANSGWHLPPQMPCAPVLTGGSVVDAAWKRMLGRAGVRPDTPVTDDPDLHLLLDGRRIDGISHRDGWHAFRLQAPRDEVRILSRCAVPQELGVARDARSLGVAVGQVMVRRGLKTRTAFADDARLSEGFHAFERDAAMRWTDGDALVPRSLFDGLDGPIELVVRLCGTTVYRDEGQN